MKRLIASLLILLLALTGCSQAKVGVTQDGTDNTQTDTTNTSDTADVQTSFAESDSDMFTDRDREVGFDASTSVIITLEGDSVKASSDSVKISGTTVTVTEEATYVLSGTLNDGMIIVDAPDTAKLQLVLDGVDITSADCAPLYILNGDKVFVTLAQDTQNSLSNGGSFTAIDDNNIDAAVFSKQDLTFNGQGSLTVTSPAGHGIVSKDDLVITSGTYTVNCASHGLDANDSVRLANSELTVDAGKDGIHAENSDDASLGFVYISSGTVNIDAEGDGISAGSYMQIMGGTFDIVTGGGSENASKQTSDSWGGFMGGDKMGDKMGGGMMRPTSISSADTTEDDGSTSIKGIKSTGDMLIADGTFNINSADDAIHSNACVTVNGGNFEIASGDDGIHADETLNITAGSINITESYEGLEALDVAVLGGDIKLVASDDGLNAAGGTDSSGFGGMRGDEQFGGRGGMMGGGGMSSSSNGSIVISGGTLYVNASGDGLDANGTLEISGGFTTVCGPTQGDTATLDYDVSGVITGGTFIGSGASGMAQTFSDAKQGVISLSVGNQTAGTSVTVKDKNGNTLIAYAPELSFAVVIISSPDIVSGETYTVSVGSSSSEFEAN